VASRNEPTMRRRRVCAALNGLIPGSDEQHAWVPETPSTLCGIAVTDPPAQLRRFPSGTRRSCPKCLNEAWRGFDGS
jgi:hypothetical protein